MMSGDEMESALEARITSALREGVASTPEARERVMRAIRASAPPVRGVADDADVVAAVAPTRGSGRFWRSPAFGLLAAASIAGVIALVRAIGVEGPIPEIPGQRVVASRREAARAPEPVVAPVAAPVAAPGALASGRTRVARVQFVFVAPQARRVAVVGDFNDWGLNDSALVAVNHQGVWSVTAPVPAGVHRYAFVVDGKEWVADPSAPRSAGDDFGLPSSALVVEDSTK
jgi:hypothetical protein